VFECLLRNCLLHGKTSASQNKTRFALDPNKGETILVFQVDQDSGRQCLGVRADSQVCDLLVLILRPKIKPILAFIELKGSDFEHGLQQINATATAARRRMRQVWDHYRVIGAVVLANNATVPRGADLKELLRQFDLDIRPLKQGKPMSVDEFLKRFDT
jgi:hypothetical protein